MQGDLQTSTEMAYSIDSDAEIDVSKVSALLVATIQEAKDRMSEVEHMFCSQLFPDYQAKSINLHRIYSEARKDAEASSKRERDLLLEIEKLQLEKQQAFKESQSLKLVNAEYERFVRASKCIIDVQEDLQKVNAELGDGKVHQGILKHLELKAEVILNNENTLQELEEKIKVLIKERSCLDAEADERQELNTNHEKVDMKVELGNKRLQLLQSNAVLVLKMESLCREHEEKTTILLGKICNLEKKVNELEMELSSKSKQSDKGSQSYEYLLKRINTEVKNNEQLLRDNDKEKRLLTAKLESLAGTVKELQEELRQKQEEVEERRNLQEELRQQIDLNGLEMLKTGQELENLLEERSLHMAKLKVLEEKADKLQSELRERSMESAEGIELHGKLLKQIETKDRELFSEKKKRKNVIDSYKRLKSQYNFLCARNGLTPENMLTPSKKEDETDPVRHSLDPSSSPGIIKDKVLKSSPINCELTRQQDIQEKLIDNQGVVPLKRLNSDLPCSSNSPVGSQGWTNANSRPLSGTKRPGSNWRETRSNQNRGGPDPHDDFLNTPLENIRGNMKKATKEEHNVQNAASKDMISESSDDETQNLNVDPDPAQQKQQILPPRAGTKGFKYVEPVRKKADRQNLKGIECKQCKKFYDAVLPDGGGKDSNKQNLRCEHHEGVSRHRYRYAPPSTPEGFWNIGFESEM